MGDAEAGPDRLSFNPQLRVEFREATGTTLTARYFVLQLAEGYLTQRLFRQIVAHM